VIAEDAVVDTLPVPGLPNMAPVRGSAYHGRDADAAQRRITNSLGRAPFEPVAVWDLTNHATLIAGTGATPLREFNAAGVVLRTFDLPIPRRPIPSRERQDSSAALAARLAALSIPLDQIEGVSEFIRAGLLPDSLPVYTDVSVASDDRLWVRVWPASDESVRTDFVVLSPTGEVEAFVTIPADLVPEVPPYFNGGLIVGVVRNVETNVQSVVVARVEMPT
jgi:hypothetical protein